MTNQTEHTIQTVLDTALNEQPMEALPAGFMSRVMEQILPQPEPFRIAWGDVVWSLLIALLAGLIILIILNMTGQTNFAWMPDATPFVSWMGEPWMVRSLMIVSAEFAIGLALYVGFWDDGAEVG